jgi:hypothetical protein
MVPLLREVWVWPPSGFRDQPWMEDRDADVFAKVARAICDRYSEALPALEIQHRTSHLRLFAALPGSPHAPKDPSRPWWTLVSQSLSAGFEMAPAGMPRGFADWSLPEQQRAVLDVVHGATVELATVRELVNRERLVEAYEHVVEHHFSYSWIGDWVRAPARGRSRGDRSAPRLAARPRYRLEPDGFGVVRVEVDVLDATGSPVRSGAAVFSADYPAWTTGRSFRRSARTAAWVSTDEFTFVPYVDLVRRGLTTHLQVTGAGTSDAPLRVTEWTTATSAAVPAPSVVDRAVAVSVPDDPAQQSALAETRTVSHRVALAMDGRTSVQVLERLAGDPSAHVRRQLARRAQLPAHLLDRLAEDPDRHVREAVAGHAATPGAALGRLAADHIWQVSYAVAQRPDIDQTVVDALCASPHKDVRLLLAWRTDLPAHRLALTTLVSGPSIRVRRDLAANTHDAAIRARLADDPEPRVSRAARKAQKAAAPWGTSNV